VNHSCDDRGLQPDFHEDNRRDLIPIAHIFNEKVELSRARTRTVSRSLREVDADDPAGDVGIRAQVANFIDFIR
jgi:hypothetical protein